MTSYIFWVRRLFKENYSVVELRVIHGIWTSLNGPGILTSFKDWCICRGGLPQWSVGKEPACNKQETQETQI